MKKLLIFFIALLSIGIGSTFFLKEKVIKVIPVNNFIPLNPPFVGLTSEHGSKFAEETKEKGYEFDWMKVDSLPKKKAYLKRLDFFLRHLTTKKFIFNDLNQPYRRGFLSRMPKEKMILILWEPPSVNGDQYRPEILDLFGTVLTWNDDLVDGKKFFKINYPDLKPLRENLPSFNERKFLCMIASNFKFNDFEGELYSLRRKAVSFFESKPEVEFDLYGRKWEGFKNAKGRIPDKLETLKNYKFNFCFENTHQSGYITEKIFDSFAVGTIPIYLGATNIEKFIPTNCFIDFRQFKGFDEMLIFIQNLTEDDYQEYFANIKAYLESPQSREFTPEALSEALSKHLSF